MKSVFVAFAVLALCLASVAVADDFYGGTRVITLTSKNFDEVVNKPNTVTLVEFYAPWCGHCKNLKPEWIKAAQQLDGIVQVAALDCDVASNKGLAGKYGIQGFPTIKIFTGKGSPSDYQGQRTAKAIVSHAKSMLPSKVTSLTAKNKDKWLKKDADMPRVILFSKKSSVAPIWKTLSVKFDGHMLFGQANGPKVKEWAEELTAFSFPSVVVLPPSNMPPALYPGKMKAKQIGKWLKRFVIDESGAQVMPDEEDDYLPELVDQSCMQKLCVKKGGLCAVLVIQKDAKDSEAMDAVMETQAARTDALFSFAWIDADRQSEFLKTSFGITASQHPQLVVFSAKKARYVEFVGSFKSDSITTFLDRVLRGSLKTGKLQGGLKELPALAGDTEACAKKKKAPAKEKKAKGSKDKTQNKKKDSTASYSVELSKSNFDDLVLNSGDTWMVEFFAPWCGHCKSLAPEWAKASKQTRQMTKFGTVDCTVETELASRFGIQGYPTIKTFKGGNFSPKKDSDANDYSGARSAKAISKHALKLLKDVPTVVEGVNAQSIQGWMMDKPELWRVLLFTDKDDLPSLYHSLSLHYINKLKFGLVHASDEQTMQQFGVKSTDLPRVMLLQAPASVNPNAENPEQQKMQIIPYAGKMNFKGISKFLDGIVDQLFPKDGAASPSAKSAPSVTVVNTQEEFDAACTSKGGLCAIVHLSEDEFESNLESHKETLLGVAAKQSQLPLNFVILNKEVHSDFFGHFRFADGNPIDFCIVNARVKRYANFLGVFDEKHVIEFIEGVLSKKIRTSSLGSLPSLASPAKESKSHEEL